jgi:hypothetical protein
MRKCLGIALASLLAALTHAAFAGDGGSLFNGKDLDGWKTKEGEKLTGKTEAYGGRFKVADGALVIDPKVKGDKYIYTTREFTKDVVLSFEFKPGEGCNNDLFFKGNKFDIKAGGKAGLKSVKVDEWNTIVITAKGDNVEFKINGTVEKAGKAKTDNTFGLRAEFGPIAIKKFEAK